MRSVVLQNESNFLYSFNSCDSECSSSECCNYTSVNFQEASKQELPYPPCSSHKFDTCGQHDRDSFYWYNALIHQELYYNDKMETFSKDESHRGIYRHDYRQNRWFSMPEMKVKVSNACMAADDNLMYLIGGKPSNNDEAHAG